MIADSTTSEPRHGAPSAIEDDLLTFEEALQVLGTSRATLYRLLGQGDIKGLKVGKQWRFRRLDLTAYIQRSPVAIAAPPTADLDTEIAFFEAALRAAGQDVDDRPEGVEQSVAHLANLLCRLALARKSSDIHIDPMSLETGTILWLRYRIDGVLHEVRQMPASLHEALIAQLKTVSGMDPVERRVPQNGRFAIGDVDFRAAIVPGFLGEMATLRLLQSSKVLYKLDDPKLGLSDHNLQRLRDLVHRPNGIVLFTGQSGSGKTVTLYSSLMDLAGPGVKIVSIEDPVEFSLPFVNQVQVNERIGQTLTSALRSCLRLDPDVLYVAEAGMSIETLEVMAEGSLNGHLLFTNVACPDAVTAITRLIDLGMERHLIAATVTGIVSQRLCRCVCKNCKESYTVPAEDLARFGLAGRADAGTTVTLARGRGCDRCEGRGLRGRTGIYEVLIVTEQIGDMIVSGAPISDIRAAARIDGMAEMKEDALEKVLAGVTTPDEVLRVLHTLA